MPQKTINREEDLYPLWELFCQSRGRTFNRRLHGIFPGQLNIFEGPDYQGAEFELDGKIYRGDVEIHLSSKDWYKHRHHLDRRYDNVVLHLVWDYQAEIIIHNSKMQDIVTLTLTEFPDLTTDSKSNSRCRAVAKRLPDLQQRLKHLAIQRLTYKVAQIKEMLHSHSADQVIYTLLMLILGSPNNSKNFEQFSVILPWDNLVSIKYRHHLSEEQWRGFILQRSGLISKESSQGWTDQTLLRLARIDSSPSLPVSIWQMSGQRPVNQPINQLNKLASWLYGYPDKSLYFPIKDIISERLSFNHLIKNLAEIFGYNTSPAPDGQEDCISTKRYSRWGQSQIIEIIGNVIIPFFYYESVQQNSFGFSEYIKEFYYYLPQSNRYAKLSSFSRWLKLHQPCLKGFYVNQALLLLKRQFCEFSDCSHCPLMGNHKDVDKDLKNF